MVLDAQTETLPYRPNGLTEVVKLPEDVTAPETPQEIVETAKHIFTTGGLPQQYEQLGQFLEGLYTSSYEERRNIDVEPFAVDLLFQQYAIKRDEALGRNGFNTFGLYALSYLDGLATNLDKARRFVRESSSKSHQPTALLLGCSSITSAVQFNQFVKAMNPEARVVIADIDPLACQLAKESGANVVQLDAQKIALEDMSIDFVATNFLVYHLRDRLGANKDTLANVMKEAARVLTRSGRVVMVEQMLTRSDEEWLSYYASDAELDFAKGFNLLNKDAVILPTHEDFDRVVRSIPGKIEDNLEEGLKPSEYSGGQQLNSVGIYTFEESRWSARRGWKRGEKVVVKSSIGEV